jgi:hypothetical protein
MAGAGSDDTTLETWRTLWKQTLGLDTVDLDGDFFQLGGDSLQALTVAGLARKAGVTAPLSAVLRWPTLRQLATETTKQSE